MRKKTIIGVLAAAAVAAGSYFIFTTVVGGVPRLEEGFGIWEPEVEIRNIYPGYTAQAPFTIINGADRDRTFAVSLQQPNLKKLRDGHVAFPEAYYSWFTMPGEDEYIEIKAGDYHQVIISVTMPQWSDYYGKNTEVRIRVSEVSATGIVQLAIESRWYIITAEKWA